MHRGAILLIVGAAVCSVDGSVRLNGGIIATGNRNIHSVQHHRGDIDNQDINIQGSYLRSLEEGREQDEEQIPSGLFQDDGLVGNLRDHFGGFVDQGAAMLSGSSANVGSVTTGGLANQIGALVDQGASLLASGNLMHSNPSNQGGLLGAASGIGALNTNQGSLLETAKSLVNSGSSGVVLGSSATPSKQNGLLGQQNGLFGRQNGLLGNVGNAVGNVFDSVQSVPVLGNAMERAGSLAGNARNVLVG